MLQLFVLFFLSLLGIGVGGAGLWLMWMAPEAAQRLTPGATTLVAAFLFIGGVHSISCFLEAVGTLPSPPDDDA